MHSQPLVPSSPFVALLTQKLLNLAEHRGIAPEICIKLNQVLIALGNAMEEGHTCLPLSQIAPFETSPNKVEELVKILINSGLATHKTCKKEIDEEISTPLVIDQHACIYWARYYDYEVRLARALQERTRPVSAYPAIQKEDIARLRRYFYQTEFTPYAPLLAAVLALHRRLLLISGGPGTGKTTTALGIMVFLLEREPLLRIALAAPTGKAALRMQEALALWKTQFPHLTETQLPQEAWTLHRLLGNRSEIDLVRWQDTARFRYGKNNPLPYDVLIVDEASMIDLSLATHLLEALAPECRLILLGDKDQLAAVEAGAVFSALSAQTYFSEHAKQLLGALSENFSLKNQLENPDDFPVGSTQYPLLEDAVIWLTHNHRFSKKTSIPELALAIRDQDSAKARALLMSTQAKLTPQESGIVFYEEAQTALSKESLDHLFSAYAPYREAIREAIQHHTDDPEKIIAAFSKFRVLCAMRQGKRGTQAINHYLDHLFRAEHEEDFPSPWYPGRPIMVTQNDYAKGLYNGDIGIALPISTHSPELHIVFSGSQGPRSFSPWNLPAHETAFAITIHKSQGSEFEHIALILPSEDHALITRELLYTGVTRARTIVDVYGTWSVFEQGLRRKTQRYTGLRRLMEKLIEEG